MRTRWVLAALALPATAAAQDVVAIPTPGPMVYSGTYFFVAMFAGLLLAIGFQYVLTTLSMAAGVSAAGPVGSWGDESRPDRDRSPHMGVRMGKAARRVTNAFGIWALVTASIALFFASWLAVELSLTVSIVAGAVLGLVIWALFQVVVVSFEATAAWSLAGTLARTVGGGLRGAWRATTGVFTPSPQARIVDTATEVARAVREELTAGIEVDRLREDIGQYVRQLAPRPLDADTIRRQIVELLDDVELRAVIDMQDLDREELVARFRARPNWDADRASRAADAVQGAVRAVREEMRAPKAPADRAADAALRVLGGMSAGEAEAWRSRFEGYLRSTGRDELDPDGLKRDLERLWAEPAAGKDALRARLAHVDRSTVASLLSARGDLTPDQAQRVVDQVEAFFRGVAAKVGAARADASERVGAARQTAADRVALQSADMGVARDRAISRIQDWLDGLGRPELAYDGIKRDMLRLFEDPRAGADALLTRLRAFDRDTVRALLGSAPGMTAERADRFVDMVLRARDEVVSATDRVREEVERRVQTAREEAVRDAEEARKTAATAAWWGFGTAVVSGGAAAAGGVVAVLF